jgi:hypothetical protein
MFIAGVLTVPAMTLQSLCRYPAYFPKADACIHFLSLTLQISGLPQFRNWLECQRNKMHFLFKTLNGFNFIASFYCQVHESLFLKEILNTCWVLILRFQNYYSQSFFIRGFNSQQIRSVLLKICNCVTISIFSNCQVSQILLRNHFSF